MESGDAGCQYDRVTGTIASRAERLLQRGEIEKGLGLLVDAARQDEPDALEMLARLSLAGDYVRRDLPLSRSLFERAAKRGNPAAAACFRAFVANGTGAPSDWSAALRLLEKDSVSDTRAAQEIELIAAMDLNDDGRPAHEFASELLSTAPEVRMFPALFSPEECDFLIQVSVPKMSPSVVVDPKTGAQVPNPVRTSDAAAYPLAEESPAVHALCERLAAASSTAVEQGEPLQVLRYRPKQEYRPHFDALSDSGNQRELTFLVYLNDDYSGGETRFLHSGLDVRGRKGDGLLFRNADEHGRPDPLSQHAGLPVSEGEKFLASRWIRARAFTPQMPPRSA